MAVVPLGETAEAAAQGSSQDFAARGSPPTWPIAGNMKKRLSRANASGAKYALILGDNELESGEAQLKDLHDWGAAARCPLDLIGDAVAPDDRDFVGANRADRGEAAGACRRDGGWPTSPPTTSCELSKDYAEIEPVAAAAREVRRLRAELEVLNGMVERPRLRKPS